MATITLVASICSILGFLVGVASTRWGRRILRTTYRSFRRPFIGRHLAWLGITDFFESRESLSKRKRSTRVFDYLSGACKEIGLIATSLNYSIVHQNLHIDLKEILQDRPDIRVYVFLLDPESPVVPSAARATGRSVSDVKQYILQSHDRLREMAKSLTDAEKNRFSVHFFDVYIASSTLVVDPYEKNGKFLVEHNTYSGSIHGRYSFECGQPGSPMYLKMLNAYGKFKQDFATSTDRRLMPPLPRIPESTSN